MQNYAKNPLILPFAILYFHHKSVNEPVIVHGIVWHETFDTMNPKKWNEPQKSVTFEARSFIILFFLNYQRLLCLDAEFVELFLVDRTGGIEHDVAPAVVLREGDTVAN